MEIKVKYNGLADRAKKITENEAMGLRMLHDDFDSDWKSGDEPHGTMMFPDDPSPVQPAPIDWQGLYLKAKTVSDKCDVLAERLGLKQQSTFQE